MTKEIIPAKFIIKNVYGEKYHSTDGKIKYFASMEDAIAVHKDLDKGIWYKPEQFIDESWKKREQDLLNTVYTRPVWAMEGWFRNQYDRMYYEHVAADDPALIEYTASGAHGMQQIYTRSAPGKFLKKAYGNLLSEQTIQMYANRHTAHHNSKHIELKYAKTPEEIVEVYKMDAGFSSCMQRSAHISSVHPTYVYGAGDLAVAYITDDAGKVLLARALVWPEHKKIGRMYGDTTLLTSLLERDGYVYKGLEDLSGARILKIIEVKNGADQIIYPYIDGNHRFSFNNPNDPNTLILTTDRSKSAYEPQHTNGYGLIKPTCPICGGALIRPQTIYARNFNIRTNQLNDDSIIGLNICENHKDNIKAVGAHKEILLLLNDERFSIESKENVTVWVYNPERTKVVSEEIPKVIFDFFLTRAYKLSPIDNRLYSQAEMVNVYTSNETFVTIHETQVNEETTFTSMYSGKLFDSKVKAKIVGRDECWSISEATMYGYVNDDKYYRSKFDYELRQNLAKCDMFAGTKADSINLNLTVKDLYDYDRTKELFSVKEEYKSLPVPKELIAYDFGNSTKIITLYKIYLKELEKDEKKKALKEATAKKKEPVVFEEEL